MPPHLASGLAWSPWSAIGEQDAGPGPSSPEQRVRETPSRLPGVSPIESGDRDRKASGRLAPRAGGMGRTAQPPQRRGPPVIMSTEHPGGRPRHLPGHGRQGSGVHRRRRAAGHAVTRAARGLRFPLSQEGSPGWGRRGCAPHTGRGRELALPLVSKALEGAPYPGRTCTRGGSCTRSCTPPNTPSAGMGPARHKRGEGLKLHCSGALCWTDWGWGGCCLGGDAAAGTRGPRGTGRPPGNAGPHSEGTRTLPLGWQPQMAEASRGTHAYSLGRS